ncbi:M23 family peptidase [Bradymonadaceae bacterium TMQ3]|uniref:M23 family metallopeptidase n=1 Tax=Lujinxingia sediminis TaxID=2480984 RepID=A0ABY0CWT8_9DELT|nr:M23 family metallopeptidase [Lujinxingia sediminis]RDV39870.1 M23 family peptidase [Bradymonadaceae bacterium TMQ3]RVU48085.1 M23 family metallopeptidase [Lujinxingia sediminis]TXC77384.1 M23 family metallopeptidase [Bradymonadales bacterium TMQ1]
MIRHLLPGVLFALLAACVLSFIAARSAQATLPDSHHSDTQAPPPLPELGQLELPWECSEAFRVTQTHDVGSHTGLGTWAFDFDLPVGTPVSAPAAGEVRLVHDDSTRHGCGPEFAWDANYVVIDLQNGYDALLLHLDAGSVTVKPGDKVEAGQVVGRVGNSGWVCGTHLHFQVQRSCSSWWCQSVPAGFAEHPQPQTGQELSRPVCEAEPQMALAG